MSGMSQAALEQAHEATDSGSMGLAIVMAICALVEEIEDLRVTVAGK